MEFAFHDCFNCYHSGLRAPLKKSFSVLWLVNTLLFQVGEGKSFPRRETSLVGSFRHWIYFYINWWKRINLFKGRVYNTELIMNHLFFQLGKNSLILLDEANNVLLYKIFFLPTYFYCLSERIWKWEVLLYTALCLECLFILYIILIICTVLLPK